MLFLDFGKITLQLILVFIHPLPFQYSIIFVAVHFPFFKSWLLPQSNHFVSQIICIYLVFSFPLSSSFFVCVCTILSVKNPKPNHLISLHPFHFKLIIFGKFDILPNLCMVLFCSFFLFANVNNLIGKKKTKRFWIDAARSRFY